MKRKKHTPLARGVAHHEEFFRASLGKQPRHTHWQQAFLAALGDCTQLIGESRKNKILDQATDLLDCAKCKKNISPAGAVNLHMARLELMQRNMVLFGEYKLFRDFVNKRQIPVLFYKKFELPATASDIVGEDIDVLVSPTYVFWIVQWYKKMGYDTSRPFAHEYYCINPKTGARIELHTTIAHKYADNNAALFESLTTDALREADVGRRTLSPEMYILVKILLFWFHDSALDLKGLYELFRFLSEHAAIIDWDFLRQYSKEKNVYRSVWFVIHFSFYYFQSPLPHGAKLKFPNSPLAWLLCRHMSHMFVLKPYPKFTSKQLSARKMRYGIINLLLAEPVRLFRLIRPRVFVGVCRIILNI